MAAITVTLGVGLDRVRISSLALLSEPSWTTGNPPARSPVSNVPEELKTTTEDIVVSPAGVIITVITPVGKVTVPIPSVYPAVTAVPEKVKFVVPGWLLNELTSPPYHPLPVPKGSPSLGASAKGNVVIGALNWILYDKSYIPSSVIFIIPSPGFVTGTVKVSYITAAAGNLNGTPPPPQIHLASPLLLPTT